MSVFVSLLLLQAATSAPTTATPASTPPDDLKIVCKLITPTGTRVGAERICLPKREWRRLNGNGEEVTREMQENFSKRGPF
jgi:hypothetical protein